MSDRTDPAEFPEVYGGVAALFIPPLLKRFKRGAQEARQ